MVIMHHGAALIQFEGTSIVHTLWSKPRMLYNAIESSGFNFSYSVIVHCIHKPCEG